MARQDYSDDDDFYEQNFEKKGVLSVWFDREQLNQADTELDTLQDLCGVGYYDLDNQESNYGDHDLVDPARLLAPLSYSQTFSDSVIAAAKTMGIEKARGVIVQYDFAYNPAVVKRPIAAEPVFIGVFPYSAD